MADNRICTFLKLCDLMNYRKTAQALNMTQPAVTQHIHYLEGQYGCTLFTYNGKILRKTSQCLELERYARSVLYNEKAFLEEFHRPKAIHLSIGATKTIGDYTMGDKLMELLKRDDVEPELLIDNTEHLLAKLNAMELDLLLVEGFVDKNCYGHELIQEEELVGICALDHPFAGKEVPLENLFDQHLILREDGSGTRAVFETFLREHGYSHKSFRKHSHLSSFKLITRAAAENCGISFVYESVAQSSDAVATFRIKGCRITHEFNYVFLKNTDISRYLALLK